MSLTFTYSDRAGTYSVDLGTTAVRLGTVALTQSAEHGDIAASQLAIDDVAGTAGHSSDQILAYHALQVTESAAPAGNQLVYLGYTQDRSYESDDSLTTGAQVRINIDLADINHEAHDAVIRVASGNRPAESVGTRLAWLNTVPNTFADNGLVVYPTTMMDAADYTNQTSDVVLDDCAQQVGYNWFLYVDETAPAGSRISLFFDDANASTAYTSSLRLSNVLTDVDSTVRNGVGATQTWAPIKPHLARSCRTLASGVVMPYAAGTEYVTNATTQALIGHVDVTAADANIKTATSALLRANRVLFESSTEEDLITCAVEVPPANVNDIRQGQRMQAKFRQLPGYKSAFTWFRVLRRTVNQAALTDKVFRIDLELSPQEAAQPATGIIQSAVGHSLSGGTYIALPKPVTIGSKLYYLTCERQNGVAGPPSTDFSQPNFGLGAWTRENGTDRCYRGTDANGMALYSKVADSTSNVGFIQERYSTCAIFELPAGTTITTLVHVDNHAAAGTATIGSLGSSTGKIALMVVGVGVDGETETMTPGVWIRDIYNDAFNWGTNSGDTISGGAFPYTWIGHTTTTGVTLTAALGLSNAKNYGGVAVLLS